MEIVRLRNRPELVPEVAGWIYREFPCAFGGESLKDWISAVAYGQLDGSLTTFVILDEGIPLATASFDLEDLSSHPHLSPWLASVYTKPEHRGRGLAEMLLSQVEKEARSRGFERIYLYTADQESFYAKRGWETLEGSRLDGEPIVVMRKNLGWPRDE